MLYPGIVSVSIFMMTVLCLRLLNAVWGLINLGSSVTISHNWFTETFWHRASPSDTYITQWFIWYVCTSVEGQEGFRIDLPKGVKGVDSVANEATTKQAENPISRSGQSGQSGQYQTNTMSRSSPRHSFDLTGPKEGSSGEREGKPDF